MKLINLYKKFYTSNGLSAKYKDVDNYLIRGPHPRISDLIELKNAGVNQIYDFRHVGMRGFKFIEKYFCKELGINYIRAPYSYLEGKYPTKDDFAAVAQNVKRNGEKGGKTLFHCNSGSHRTAHMAAFYDLTRGESIEKVYSQTDPISYADKVQNVLEKHFYSQKYFSRSIKDEKTLNPITRLKNIFNNRVIKGTELAHSSFLAIITRYKNW